MTQEEMRQKLMALDLLTQEQKKTPKIGSGIVSFFTGAGKVCAAFLKWMLCTAVALCAGICKLCFGFFLK